MKFFCIAIFLLLLSGCATILSPRMQDVVINTNNDNAEIYMNSVKVGSGKQIKLNLKKEGVPIHFTIKSPETIDRSAVIMQAQKSKYFKLNYIFLLPLFFDTGKKSNNYLESYTIEKGRDKYSFYPDSLVGNIGLAPINFNGVQIYYKKVWYEDYLEKKTNKVFTTKDWIFTDHTLYVQTKWDLVENILDPENMNKYLFSLINEKVNVIDTINPLMKLNAEVYNIELIQVKYEDQNTAEIYFYVYNAKIRWSLEQDKNTLFSTEIAVTTDEYVRNKSEICYNLLEKSLHSLYLDEEFMNQIYKRNSYQYDSDTSKIVIRQSNLVSTLKDAVYSSVTVKSKTGHGSGFFIGDEGEIITNDHVVSINQEYEIQLNDGTIIKADVIRRDKVNDLAILKCNHSGHKVFSLNTINPPELGQEIFVIGTPNSEEFNQTITKGIFSGEKNIENIKYYQTDAAINSGNSGGPMINKKGELFGVVVAKIVGSDIEGLGFAIPAEKIIKNLNLIIK